MIISKMSQNVTWLAGQLHPRLRHSSMRVEKFLLANQTPFSRLFRTSFLKMILGFTFTESVIREQ